MSNLYSRFEEIERYLSGEMEPGEQLNFEEGLKNDAALKEQLDLYRNLNGEYSVMEQSKAGEEALSGTLANMNRKYFFREEDTLRKKAPVRKLLFALAAAASLFFAFFLLKPVIFGKGDKDLFNEYYPEEQFPRERGKQDSASMAADFFDRKDYANALAILEPFTKSHPEKTEYQEFKGWAYLLAAQYGKAEEVFSALANGNAPEIYREKAKFLQAGVLLKQNRKEDCKKILLEIPEKSTYYKKAKELLGDL
jgi:hypothetical protein